MFPLSDLALSRRLERAEGSANRAFVGARARHDPALGATWREIAGAYALFDGVGSPCTQSFGLGLFAQPTHESLEEVERFFGERGAETFHEVSPLADAALLALLPERGFSPVELTSVMCRPLAVDEPAPDAKGPSVRTIGQEEAELWARTSARGWAESPELEEFMMQFGRVNAGSEGTTCFLAELGGEPVAAAALGMHGGVAMLAGASTIPRWRGRGAQAALLRARLRHAQEHGCDLAMMGALPGSASQRNAERQGFRIVYTRIKWGKRGMGHNP